MGDGRAWYVASRNDDRFLLDFYERVVADSNPLRVYAEPPAPGVHATMRAATNDDGSVSEYRFLINFSAEPASTPELMPGEQIVYRSPEPNTGDPEHDASSRGEPGSAEEATLPVYGVQVRRLTR